MSTKSISMGILNELSDFIVLRMKSYFEAVHGEEWIEHKSHAMYDLWFVQSGIIHININGIQHQATAGDVVLFYPKKPYMASTTNEGCRFIYLHFDFEIGGQQQILNDFQLSGIIPQQLIHQEASLFSEAFYHSKQHHIPGNRRLYMKGYLLAVIARIIEIHDEGRYSGSFIDNNKSKQVDRGLDLLQPVFQYIHQHLHQSIKLSELASLIGLSEKYFISYFKKAIGITPGQYVYQIRMNRAKDYLYQKKYTIQEIAHLLGYSDQFSFSKAFKRYYHVPPSRFE